MSDRRRLFVLNNPNAPRLCPELAKEIGLPESIILLQLEFWISISDHHLEEKWWTYQSIRTIQKTFVFWSPETINRAIKRLVDIGLIETGNFNQKKYDKTRWFSISEESVNKLSSIKMDDSLSQNKTGRLKKSRAVSNQDRVSQNETGSSQNETTIPETTAETTAETTSKTTPENDKAEPSPVQIVFDAIHAFYGYPEKTQQDPIPSYPIEGQSVKKMIKRGFTPAEIIYCWSEKVKDRKQYILMAWVNNDIAGAPQQVDIQMDVLHVRGQVKVKAERRLERKLSDRELKRIQLWVDEKVDSGWTDEDIMNGDPFEAVNV